MGDKIFRVFTISGFGVYNCDAPHMYPQGANVMANFKGENGTDAHRSFPRDTCGFLKGQTYTDVVTFASILKKIFFI